MKRLFSICLVFLFSLGLFSSSLASPLSVDITNEVFTKSIIVNVIDTDNSAVIELEWEVPIDDVVIVDNYKPMNLDIYPADYVIFFLDNENYNTITTQFVKEIYKPDTFDLKVSAEAGNDFNSSEAIQLE